MHSTPEESEVDTREKEKVAKMLQVRTSQEKEKVAKMLQV